ncbi:DKNYY domain-containing protein [Dyadobacter luticola]|uniref:DKNYY domain-containing protein n=1 Tax=Dyadobacter luticola TaxID=1979387 RepID=A0A5R9L643_9BACT|nr:DKNYY domain-containing protein [Dyadobacter luticola]TLV03859.1 hypothetical protein FEN17_09770 [Dyadobacter luticola]
MTAKKCFATMSLLSIFQIFFSCSDKKPGVTAAAGYYFYDEKWHYYGGFSNASYLEISGADTASFEKLDGTFPLATYARDKNLAYYNGKAIPGAIGKSFSRIKGYLSKDEAHVFYLSSMLSDDPTHFEIVDENVSRDSRHVFWGDHVISKDPVRFKPIGKSAGLSYYTDSKGVIANSNRLSGADANTFQILSHGYSKDKSNVFLIDGVELKTINEADPATFKVLNAYYSLDAKYVFWNGLILENADPASFRILNEEVHCGADHQLAYHRNVFIPNADPASFPKNKPCKYCTDEKVVFE